MIYLASPYSADPERNYKLALSSTALMIADGHVVYSPVVYYHTLRQAASPDIKFWWRHNFGMLRLAAELWVLDIEGWQASAGVQAEIEFAGLAHIPRSLIDSAGLLRRELPIRWSVD